MERKGGGQIIRSIHAALPEGHETFHAWQPLQTTFASTSISSSATFRRFRPGIRPRTLTLARRKPERRELRVLKRLTWTEPDGFAQQEKLLAAYSVADWSEEHFNNRALFSDYYLLERLREFPEWGQDPKAAYLALRERYGGAAARFAGKPLADLKTALIEPALTALGFKFEREPRDCRCGFPRHRCSSADGASQCKTGKCGSKARQIF